MSRWASPPRQPLVAIRLGPLDHLLATPAPIDVDQGSGGDQMPKAVARLGFFCVASTARLKAEAEQILPHHLDIRGRHHVVMRHHMHVAKASFEPTALIDR